MKTPQQSYPALTKAIGTDAELYLKREDLHLYGSHKGRSIPGMIKHYAKNGVDTFVISSSGNAALAAILATTAHNENNPDHPITLSVFVGQHADLKKIDILRKAITDSRITLEQVERPKQQAFQLEKSGKTKNLRQSTDDLALEGYGELADELSKIPNLQAVFVPTSSGTTAQGVAEAFEKQGLKIEVHVVQTATCHPIVDAIQNKKKDLPASLSSDEERTGKVDASRSIASAIVDHVAHRKDKVSELVVKSGGNGWIIPDDEILAAQQLIKNTAGFDTSPNSALSVAALIQAKKTGRVWSGPVVCLLTGR